MVRDMVAMANTSGGYIVLGVNENRSGGTLTFEPIGISEEHLKSLDIDKLKPQIESYLNVSVPIKLQIHRLDEHGGRCFALVYVKESAESPIIMEKDGQYQDDNGRTKGVFRAGDVVVRDGASSRRADQNAVREQISKMRRRERERWTEETLGVRELVERIDQLVGVLGGVYPCQVQLILPDEPVRRPALRMRTTSSGRRVSSAWCWGPLELAATSTSCDTSTTPKRPFTELSRKLRGTRMSSR